LGSKIAFCVCVDDGEVVAGVAGAGLNVGVILVLGFSNLIADGISMGIGDFLSSKADIDYRKQERKRELWYEKL
jgi:VIT1/CCC1 family predicted Fe2+/Mn2+ transporter